MLIHASILSVRLTNLEIVQCDRLQGLGAAGDVFFGPETVLGDRPLTADVKLPGGSWQILARPSGGWAAALPPSRFCRRRCVAGRCRLTSSPWA